MRQFVKLFVFLAVILVPSMPAHAGQPDVGTFEIQVSIDQNSLKSDFYKMHGRFFVDTRIKNASRRDQSIIIWTQQGWSWLSDNQYVEPGTEALQNIPSTIVLHPGDEYKGRMEMVVARMPDEMKAMPIIFRLGFYPKAELPISGQPHPDLSQVFWSNTALLDR